MVIKAQNKNTDQADKTSTKWMLKVLKRCLLQYVTGVYSSIIPPTWWGGGGKNQRVLGPEEKIKE